MEKERLESSIDKMITTIDQVNDLVSINKDIIFNIMNERAKINELTEPFQIKMATGMLLNTLDNKLHKLITTNDIIVDMLNNREQELSDCSMHQDAIVKGGAEHD